MIASKFNILFHFLCCCVLVVIYGHNYSKEDLDFLANLKLHDLPLTIQSLLQKSTRFGENTNWCCKNDHDKHVTYRTERIQKQRTQIISTKVRSSSSSCGFLGLSKCNTYEVRYTTKIVYFTATQFIPNAGDCPDRMIVCCNNYINVANHCLSLDKIVDLTDTLIKLKENGLLLGNGVIG